MLIIQSTIVINLLSWKDNYEERDKEVKTNGRTYGVIEKVLKSLLNRYWNNLETSMRGSDFIIHCVHLLHCKCHQINPNRGGSYINSPEWIKKEKKEQ